jgi:hypothetical protein
MIRFFCPRCETSLSASSRKVGSVSSCPRCRQRLQVPSVPAVAPEAEEPSPDVELAEAGQGGFLRLAAYGLRCVVWLGCVAGAAYLAWPYLPLSESADLAGTTLSGAGPLVLMGGAYIMARAVDSLAQVR